MIEKEFGYTVSRDYEKLWKMLLEDREVCVIYGMDEERTFGSAEMYECFKHIALYRSGDKNCIEVGISMEELICECKKIDLTFIDPEQFTPKGFDEIESMILAFASESPLMRFAVCASLRGIISKIASVPTNEDGTLIDMENLDKIEVSNG